MKKPDLHRLSLYAGIFLLAAGVQLRMVEAYVLTAPATRWLADWFGAEPGTARGTLQWLVLNTSAPRHVVAPPPWLGWAVLSLGVVLIANGVLRRKR